MRNNFWKWLKRFFVVLPIIMMLLQIIFSMGSYWRDNGTLNFTIGDDDFIQQFVRNGQWNANGIGNPLLVDPSSYNENSVYGSFQISFIKIYGRIIGTTNINGLLENFVNYPDSYTYEIILINFLTWWVFVELVFLFFRFVTFLISWVNSLFDNTFKKIKK